MRIDSSGLPVPDCNDLLEAELQLSTHWFCPDCSAPTWPAVHHGELHARRCVPCQQVLDLAEEQKQR